ncbi:MAG: MBL fold metallo-hydrolase [Eubacteriales bacterium]
MKLTVLGKYGPYPKAVGACSSYFIEYGNAKVLLDAGNGSFANLQKAADVRSLDAIIVSHLHSDHISDLLVMRYAIQIKKCPPIPLVLPATPADMYGILAGDKAYTTDICTDGKTLKIKGATFTFKK